MVSIENISVRKWGCKTVSTMIMHIAEAPGGVERYLVTILTKFKQYPKFEHILVCSSSFDIDKFNGLVKEVLVIDEMKNALSLTHDVKSTLLVRKAIKSYNPEIIYCHSSKAGAIGRMANLGIKNKLVYNAHGWSFNIRGSSLKKIKFYETIERMLAPFADKIVCISEYEKKSALKHKICNADKLLVINNGIDYEEFENQKPKCRNDLGIPEDAFVVGAIGRLTKQKAPDVFVKMAKMVKEKIPNAFFLMVGDDIGSGYCRVEIEKQIEEEKLKESFLITGWVNNPIDYMNCFDVATLLSRWEGFGLVLPEYMYMKKPIVATNVDAIPYVVGDAGILVDMDDYESAAYSIIKIYEDHKCKEELIRKEIIRVKLFDAQKTVSELAKLFSLLIKL